MKKQKNNKIKIGPSIILIIILCVATNNVLLLFNYFVALLIHEFAHLYVAIKHGYKFNDMKIDVFGVSVKLSDQISPADSFSINIAGPLSNLIVCVICLALYYLFPVSYIYLNLFCLANLFLALFNLMPIYPLDGGKIFYNLFKAKTYRIISTIIRYTLAVIFLIFFIVYHNIFCLVMSFFFIVSRENKTPTITIFKRKAIKDFQKVIILNCSGSQTLFDMLKKISNKNYTIFYCKELAIKYIDEDQIIEKSIKHPLTTKLVDAF